MSNGETRALNEAADAIAELLGFSTLETDFASTDTPYSRCTTPSDTSLSSDASSGARTPSFVPSVQIRPPSPAKISGTDTASSITVKEDDIANRETARQKGVGAQSDKLNPTATMIPSDRESTVRYAVPAGLPEIALTCRPIIQWTVAADVASDRTRLDVEPVLQGTDDSQAYGIRVLSVDGCFLAPSADKSSEAWAQRRDRRLSGQVGGVLKEAIEMNIMQYLGSRQFAHPTEASDTNVKTLGLSREFSDLQATQRRKIIGEACLSAVGSIGSAYAQARCRDRSRAVQATEGSSEGVGGVVVGDWPMIASLTVRWPDFRESS